MPVVADAQTLFEPGWEDDPVIPTLVNLSSNRLDLDKAHLVQYIWGI